MTDHQLDITRRFRTSLMAARPQRARRYLRVAAITTAAAAVSAVVFLGGSTGGGTMEALAVSSQGNATVVRIEDATAGPQQLTNELRKAGINAVVLIAPTTADRVGTWVDVSVRRVAGPGVNTSVHDSFDQEGFAAQARAQARKITISGDEARIPADFDKPIALVAGGPTKPGEQPIYP